MFYARYGTFIADWIHTNNPNCRFENVSADDYELGAFRPRMYERMARKVVDAALAGESVVLIEPGSAVTSDVVTQCVLALARPHRLRVRILPAVSCVEGVVAALGFDPSAGLQIVQAMELVLRGKRLSPDMAAVVIQPGYYDTLWYVGGPRSKQGRFDVLQEGLARSYPSETPVALVRLSLGHAEPDVFWTRLGSLDSVGSILTPLHTLFVAAPASEVANESFRERVLSRTTAFSHVELDESGLPRQTEWSSYGEELQKLDPRLVAESSGLAEAWAARKMSTSFCL